MGESSRSSSSHRAIQMRQPIHRTLFSVRDGESPLNRTEPIDVIEGGTCNKEAINTRDGGGHDIVHYLPLSGSGPILAL